MHLFETHFVEKNSHNFRSTDFVPDRRIVDDSVDNVASADGYFAQHVSENSTPLLIYS